MHSVVTSSSHIASSLKNPIKCCSVIHYAGIFSNFVSAHVCPAWHYCHTCSVILHWCPDPLPFEPILEKIQPQKNIQRSSVNEKLQCDVIPTDAGKDSTMYYFSYSLNSFVFKQLPHNILINGFATLIFFQAPLFL